MNSTLQPACGTPLISLLHCCHPQDSKYAVEWSLKHLCQAGECAYYLHLEQQPGHRLIPPCSGLHMPLDPTPTPLYTNPLLTLPSSR
jgi:hypothetical protein